MKTIITILKSMTVACALAGFSLSISSCAGSGGTVSAAQAGVKPYPLKVCIVTGNDLGSMGDEQRIVHQGQEIKFCCTPCVEKFHANPAKYLAKIR